MRRVAILLLDIQLNIAIKQLRKGMEGVSEEKGRDNK